MIEKYPYFKVSLITTVALGKRTTGGNSTSIRSGKISFTPAEMLAIDTKLEWISGFVGIVNRLAGRKLNWYDALSFVYDEPSVSNEILKEKIIKNAHLIHSAPTILEAVEQLEKIYNLYSRGEIVYIAQMFRVEQDRKRRVKS